MSTLIFSNQRLFLNYDSIGAKKRNARGAAEGSILQWNRTKRVKIIVSGVMFVQYTSGKGSVIGHPPERAEGLFQQRDHGFLVVQVVGHEVVPTITRFWAL